MPGQLERLRSEPRIWVKVQQSRMITPRVGCRHGSPRLGVLIWTQRWAPEELLRTLVDTELVARDAFNARTRMKSAAFPVVETLAGTTTWPLTNEPDAGRRENWRQLNTRPYQ
jgi:hypothetical protein